MKKLPIGTQDFETLRRDNCLYVDKTADIHRLITEGRVYFLARPRRFGKSLLVSALKAVFEGRRDLFEGLAIDALPYEWTTHPVLHLDFGTMRFADPDTLTAWLRERTLRFCAAHGLPTEGLGPEGILSNALEALARQGKRTAVLIDEYDKPLLDHIEDTPVALRMRETLKSFYGSLKSSDAFLRFVLLTGVSKFAKMNVFFANIPYDIQMRSEKYCQSVFYLIFSLLGLRIEAEARTNRGRIDAVAATRDAVYLFEFKLDGTAEEALAQCRESDYARRYRDGTRPVMLVGVPFDTQTRNIGTWLSASA